MFHLAPPNHDKCEPYNDAGQRCRERRSIMILPPKILQPGDKQDSELNYFQSQKNEQTHSRPSEPCWLISGNTDTCDPEGLKLCDREVCTLRVKRLVAELKGRTAP